MKARDNSVFVCKECGNESAKWMGQCPSCQTWNSMVEAPGVGKNPKSKYQISNKFQNPNAKTVAVRLEDVKVETGRRMSTGISELDMVLGGGIVGGQAILVAGEPGIGKSTLLLQVAAQATDESAYFAKASKGKQKSNLSTSPLPSLEAAKGVARLRGASKSQILYVCGEESAGQIAIRAKRLEIEKEKGTEGILVLSETDIDATLDWIDKSPSYAVGYGGASKSQIELVIVDSIQTMTTNDLPGTAGSVGQVRECALRLVTMAKETGIPVFIVGHVTKDGDIAGPRILEHMVDTVLWFEGERSQALRLVRTIKNRFGPTDEVGVFRMTDKGLIEVANPSEYLLAERVKNVPGSVVSIAMEGTRPMLVEVQALTVATQLPVPRRVATGIDFNRLQMLVAILTRRAGIDLSGVDVFVNVAGGVKVSDPALDLAVCLAIASSYRDKAVDPTVAAVGEVGLMGEVRKVGDLDRRVKEAKKLGYRVASAESGREVRAAVGKLVG